MPEFPQNAIERFWSKVDRSGGEGACWPWLRGVDKDGYGKFQTGPSGWQTHWRAHRVAMLLDGREPGAVTRHSCDNPRCCNPRHLSSGSQLDNRRDCVERDRQTHGEAHPRALLTAADVVTIREEWKRGVNGPVLAARFSVSKQAIYAVVSGRNWKRSA